MRGQPKSQRPSVLVILACLAVSGGAVAATPAPSAGFTRELLPNGVTLIVSPRTSSNVVGMEVISRVGTRYESPDQAGLANLTLQVMAEGAGEWKAGAAREWFEERGATLDLKTHPDFSELGSAVTTADFKGMAEIMAALAGDATISDRSFQKQQAAIVREIASPNHDDQPAAYQSLRTLLAEDTAYGRPEVGLASTVSTLRWPDVRRFYHTMFAPHQLIVVVSGNVRPATAVPLLRQLFGKLPARLQPPEPGPLHTNLQEPSSMVLGGYGAEAWVMVGYLTPGVKAGDYPALAVLNAIVGGSNSGRIATLFRDKNGVYDSGSFIQPFATQTHIVGYVRAEPLLWDQQQQHMKPVIDDFRKQLVDVFADIAEHGVTPEQVAGAQSFVLGQYLRTQERNRDHAAYLGWYEALGLGAEFDDRFPKEIAATSAEQINKLARTYLQTPSGATVVMLPRPRVEESP